MIIISPFKRKLLKITAYVLGSIVVLLAAFHFWFVNHAERLLEDLVSSKSNGKLKLHVQKFRFNWFSNDMQLRNAVFYSTDTSTATTAYRFTVDRINVRIKQILPLVFEKKILIDSIGLVRPDIEVTRLRATIDNDTTADQRISLPLEMGRVYKSIQDGLQMLQVNRFRIEGGRFSLINKIQDNAAPVRITNIQFHLDNLQVDPGQGDGKQKILFSDNVALQTNNQDIVFPDGRHRLSFSNFRINLLKKRVEFDSCTISATKGDSSKSSFTIFFDKLALTNIDFDTLYQKEVIKADSVYCTNPRFILHVDLEKKGTGERKDPPKLNELIQQLTGDLHLAFVVVENGSFDIKTVREGRPSSFTSDHNNFELQGLRIQKNAPQPLTVKSFAMAIRNYENFLKDSTYALSFDSILLNTQGIYLSNFNVRQMQKGNLINSFNMPQFEVIGLSWDDLVFDQKFTAQRATLYQPVINYTFRPKPGKRKKKQNLFATLDDVGDLIQLNNLDIANGRLNLHFAGGAQLQLENATMSLLSQNIVNSNRLSNLQGSVRHLRFERGVLRTGNLVATMENVDFTGKDGQLVAGIVNVTNKQKNLSVKAKNVVITSMQIDNNSFVTEIDGIKWDEADVQISGSQGKKDMAPDFVVRNLLGRKTKLSTGTGDQKLSAFFETLSADEFLPTRNNKPRITNLFADGRNLSFTKGALQLAVSKFLIDDHSPSRLDQVTFTNNTSTDSVSAVIPSFTFTPDLNSIIAGGIKVDDVTLSRPVIRIIRQLSPANTDTIDKKSKAVNIGKLTLLQPELLLSQPGRDGFTRIEWHGQAKKNNAVTLTDFKISEQSAITAGNILFSLRDFSFTAGGKTFDAGEGELSASINGFELKPSDVGELEWHGEIADLKAKDLMIDSMGKQGGKLDISSARLGKLSIGSATLLDVRQMVKENKSFRLTELTGTYDDAQSHFNWNNASYDKFSRTFTLDSFNYHPTATREEFIAASKTQDDYLTLETGAISVGPFDIDKFLYDTIVDAGSVNIDRLYLSDYRDKRLPFEGGVIKPLPVDLLKKLPIKLTLDSVSITNSTVLYSEVNHKNNKTGNITVDRLNARMTSVRNFDHEVGDSLRVQAHAYLLDSVPIALTVTESYTDTLSGFLMTVKVPAIDARVLNPILIPLASIEIKSAMIDSLSMYAEGREYAAKGEMTLYYHDLKIKVLNTKSGSPPSTRGFFTFLANTFFIKNSNTSRKGLVFFKRDREKSAMNYLVKIALSGIGSSIGAKSNKKQLRRFEKRKD
ncbi:MAG: hypothetical protein H7Y42_16485 [Chitinophagaceae bacterium]|nr:hypothetical protein [Chitinophagaceae bacterium]